MTLTDTGFTYSVLCEFRKRLIEGRAVTRLLERMFELLSVLQRLAAKRAGDIGRSPDGACGLPATRAWQQLTSPSKQNLGAIVLCPVRISVSLLIEALS